MPYPAIIRRLIAPAAALAALLLTVVTAGAASASAQNVSAPAQNSSAQTALPVNYDFAAGAATTFNSPTTPPPGANNFSCQPSAAHPYPVVLVHGTLAKQLAAFVNQVLAATGAAKVDLVGHSQGGMMPRYYINFLGGAAKVATFVALAPSNYGTTLDGLTQLGLRLGIIMPINSALSTPYTNAFLPAAPNVTNITVNQQCLLDSSDHLEIAADPVAMADMLNALDPADPVRVPCLVVLPVTGPVGPVPSF